MYFLFPFTPLCSPKMSTRARSVVPRYNGTQRISLFVCLCVFLCTSDAPFAFACSFLGWLWQIYTGRCLFRVLTSPGWRFTRKRLDPFLDCCFTEWEKPACFK
ncbi:hypothetical protein Mapa_017688 [Marchantia paleacea]|nr:hypothetical protein Mapa_017688 [Marchantia paleacea]